MTIQVLPSIISSCQRSGAVWIQSKLSEGAIVSFSRATLRS